MTSAASAPATDALARPLRRDAERNRERILLAAGEVFAERGLEVTLDEIARHAGLGVGTIYRRFPNREVLIEALFEQKVDDVVQLAKECLTDPDPWQGLVRFLEQAIAMQATDRGLREVMLSSAYGQERVAHAKGRCIPVVRALVTRAQEAGTLRADIGLADLPVIELMVSAAAEYTRGIDPDVWSRYLGIMLDGLRSRRDGPSALPVASLSEDQIVEAMRCFRPAKH